MRRHLVLYAAHARAAIRTSFADRANFALQVAGMLVNDLFMLALWVLFFAGFRSVGGWGLADMALLIGMVMTIVGLAGVFLGGYRDMAAAILRGELEPLLTQPTGLIGRLLARESIASAWGDLLLGIGVLATVAKLTLGDLPALLVGLAAGLTVYVAAAISFATLAFWAAGARSFARDLTDFTLLFSTYPASIYAGAVKVVAYTLLPAGFVVMTPVSLLRAPSAETLALALAGALGYATLAVALFHLSLRTYRRVAVAAGG